MAEYIEREAAKQFLAQDYAYAAAKLLDYIPAADVAPVRHGEWFDIYENKYSNHFYACSVCGGKALYDFEVDELGHERAVQVLSLGCPHCLAKMDGKGEGE